MLCTKDRGERRRGEYERRYVVPQSTLYTFGFRAVLIVDALRDEMVQLGVA